MNFDDVKNVAFADKVTIKMIKYAITSKGW